MNRRWRRSLAIVSLLACMTPAGLIMAEGNINGNEAAILSAMDQEYVYQGDVYRLDASYKAGLREKFMEDGVDLTAEQKERYIAQAYAEIGKGVSEGYLIKVREAKKEEEKEAEKQVKKAKKKVAKLPKDTPGLWETLESGDFGNTEASPSPAPKTVFDQENATSDTQGQTNGKTSVWEDTDNNSQAVENSPLPEETEEQKEAAWQADKKQADQQRMWKVAVTLLVIVIMVSAILVFGKKKRS